tara:strand:- start:7024 stop:7125 length:102 start_codon:yes stop_codon:yes gene_type:complete
VFFIVLLFGSKNTRGLGYEKCEKVGKTLEYEKD